MNAAAPSAADALAQLTALSGADRVTATITEGPPALETPFLGEEAAAAALAAGAAEAAGLWALRTGEDQTVSVDTREAAASLVSFLFQRFDDPARAPTRAPPATAANGFLPTGDGRFVYLHPSFDESAGHLKLLGCADTPAAVRAALARWTAPDLEAATAEAGLCAAMVRTPDEWDASDQGRRLAATPIVEVTRIGDGPPVPFSPAPDAPLSGVRVLDLTRVLAGPACARALASYGADVLHISGPDLPSFAPFVSDTGHGKRCAFLDLKTAAGRETLQGLVGQADVFSQGYRTGALARLGFGPEALAAVRPGLIHVSINCYGHEGDWAGRPGWEQLAQTVSGMAHVQGAGGEPALLPAAVNDYTTGYLAAFGAMVALRRRAVEGGSWRVRVSLTRTAMCVRGLGLRTGVDALPFTGDELAAWSIREDGGWGPVSFLRPPVRMAKTPAAWTRPSVKLGSNAAVW
jgi:crotonobetainyl-CoA:carnitine CoA-transferase CaiB-like acyl-CoA transferase